MEDVFCRSCRWWDQRYPGNTNLGACTKMGVIFVSGDAAINLREGIDHGRPTSDVREVRTQATYGCIGHTREGTLLTSREVREYEERGRA